MNTALHYTVIQLSAWRCNTLTSPPECSIVIIRTNIFALQPDGFQLMELMIFVVKIVWELSKHPAVLWSCWQVIPFGNPDGKSVIVKFGFSWAGTLAGLHNAIKLSDQIVFCQGKDKCILPHLQGWDTGCVQRVHCLNDISRSLLM